MFPLGDKELKIGILGMTEGNGHPYSWSAMFNGYTKEYMDEYKDSLMHKIAEENGGKVNGITAFKAAKKDAVIAASPFLLSVNTFFKRTPR